MQRRELIKISFCFLGGAAGASVSRALLAADSGASLTTAAAPFDAAQSESVRLLCDMIIPRTDTPGAVDAGVHDFIASIYADWYTDTERRIFLQGLSDLDAYCLAQQSAAFHETTDEVRLQALQEQERLAANYKPPESTRLTSRPPEAPDAPFFRKLKELVVLGYYTSEIGATQEMAYLPVPGKFDGNYDFIKVGRHWSH